MTASTSDTREPMMPAPAGPPTVGDLLQHLAPGVLSSLVARYGQFDACEDAVQEALADAVIQWPRDGVPVNPRGWLMTAARRSLVDAWRSDAARRRREHEVALLDLPVTALAGSPMTDDAARGSVTDDTLSLLFLCCHPALTPPSQLALTLRTVAGLTTAQIAAAFHIPEPTMSQRISRAKREIRAAGARFELPAPKEFPARLAVVLQVLYLVFNEGYTSSAGERLDRPDLVAEAIRITRLLHRLLPDDAEVTGLLALMLLVHARRPARAASDGSLVPLDEQDRHLWDRRLIEEGLTLLHGVLGSGPIGPYQVQAAIAALHDEAAAATETDWPQILALYEVLERVAPSPMVRLSRAVAVARVHGPVAALAVVGTLDDDARASHNHRVDAVRGHLLEQVGDLAAARQAYLRAARATASLPEQRYLRVRAARLTATSTPDSTEP